MAKENPYVGPKSFEAKNRNQFFGRKDETRELISLVMARRAVLLYSQSGAGKTSLLKASVIPDLETRKRMRILPVARVSGEATLAARNIYTTNALAHLRASNASAFGGMRLVEGLQEVVGSGSSDDERRAPELLVFDQFEEIFTLYPERTDLREDFFAQLNECLEKWPQLGLLIAMREDYLADMESWAGLLPDRLRTRMRLERLAYDAAVLAVRQPAANAGKPFDEGVAEALVKDLGRVQKEKKGTSLEVNQAPRYVEPVYLQIVCWQLWEHLPDSTATITAADVQKHADVDGALTQFYTDALDKACEAAGVSQRALRDWVGRSLITPAKTRGLVFRSDDDTAGMSNQAVDSLEKSYLIRRDVRGPWYELTHDRLLDPIVESNRSWQASHPNPVADAYHRWVAAGRVTEKLLNGNQLKEANEYRRANPGELSRDESAYLDASVEHAAQVRRGQRLFGIAAAVVMFVVLGAAALAISQRNAAVVTSGKAFLSQLDALQSEYEANGSAFKETAAKKVAEGAQREAESAQQDAQHQALAAKRALAQGDAESAATLLQLRREDAALAYLARSLRSHPDGASTRAEFLLMNLLRAGAWSAGWTAKYPKLPAGKLFIPSAVITSPDGRLVVLCLGASAEGMPCQAYDAFSGTPVGSLFGGIRGSFSRDSSRIVMVPGVLVYRAGLFDPDSALLFDPTMRYFSAEFSPDGNSILAAGREGVFVLDSRLGKTFKQAQEASAKGQSKDAIEQSNPARSIGPKVSARSARYNSNGDRILVTTEDGFQIWDTSGKVLAEQPVPKLLAAEFAPSGDQVVTATQSALQVWQLNRTVSPVGRAVPIEATMVSSLMFNESATNVLLASAAPQNYLELSTGGTAKVWNLTTGEQLGNTFRPARAATFGRAGTLITASTDGLQMWGRGVVWSEGIELPFPNTGKLAADMAPVAMSRDGGVAAVAAEGGIELHDAITGRTLPGGNLRSGTGRAWPVFSPDGSRVLAVGSAIAQWDCATLRPVRPEFVYRGAEPLVAASFSRDGRVLLARSNKEVWFWRTDDGKPLRSPVKLDRLNYAALQPGGQRVILAADMDSLTVADLRSAQMEKHDWFFLEFDPQGTQALMGSKSGLQVLNPVTLEAVKGARLAGGDVLLRARFSPDGRVVAAVDAYRGAGRLLHLRDARSGQSIGDDLEADSLIGSLSFSPDSQLVAASTEKAANIWDVTTGRLVGRLRNDGYTPVQFTPDSRRVIVVEAREKQWIARIVDLRLPGGRPEQVTLADLAEIVAAAHLDEHGSVVPIGLQERGRRLRQLRAGASRLDPRVADAIGRYSTLFESIAGGTK